MSSLSQGSCAVATWRRDEVARGAAGGTGFRLDDRGLLRLSCRPLAARLELDQTLDLLRAEGNASAAVFSSTRADRERVILGQPFRREFNAFDPRLGAVDAVPEMPTSVLVEVVV
jgi:hypothetical protein